MEFKKDENLRFDLENEPFGDDNTFDKGKNNFCQFKFETQSIPKQ